MEEVLYSKFYLESSVETVGDYVSNSNKVQVQIKSIIYPENIHYGNNSNYFKRVLYALDDKRGTQTQHSQNLIILVIPPQPDSLITKIAVHAIDFFLLPPWSCLKHAASLIFMDIFFAASSAAIFCSLRRFFLSML